MSLSRVTTGRTMKPRRILLYGQGGIGKTTFAAMSDRPVFIPTEDGLCNIDCAAFPLARTYTDVIRALGDLYTETHEYRTIVIDSADWLERLIHAEVCRQRDAKTIDDIGYAKGYAFALAQWKEVLDGLDALRNDRSMAVIIIAHAEIQKFQNPETDGYDRYVPRLHKSALALVYEWSDEVLFAAYKVFTRKTGESFGKATHKAIGTGERVLRTTERPAYLAKNRLNLPDEIPLNYEQYAKHVRGD